MKPTRPKDTKESATDQDNQLSYQIIGAAIEVHRTLGGPGLLESIYEDALRYELSLQGLKVQSQVPVKVCYKGAIIRDPLFLDLLVTDMSKKESDGSSIDVANSSSLGLWVFGFNFLFYLSPHTIEQVLRHQECYLG